MAAGVHGGVRAAADHHRGACAARALRPFVAAAAPTPDSPLAHARRQYFDDELDGVLELCNRLEERLTAAVVSNDPVFTARALGGTGSGTTYAGLRARTTGAPANHWFGPGGDPRAAGIGTPEAVRAAWSGHREVVTDVGPLPPAWRAPAPT